jgi:hypothetical protein
MAVSQYIDGTIVTISSIFVLKLILNARAKLAYVRDQWRARMCIAGCGLRVAGCGLRGG